MIQEFGANDSNELVKKAQEKGLTKKDIIAIVWVNKEYKVIYDK